MVVKPHIEARQCVLQGADGFCFPCHFSTRSTHPLFVCSQGRSYCKPVCVALPHALQNSASQLKLHQDQHLCMAPGRLSSEPSRKTLLHERICRPQASNPRLGHDARFEPLTSLCCRLGRWTVAHASSSLRSVPCKAKSSTNKARIVVPACCRAQA